MQAGLERMYGPDTPDEDRDVIYYLTLYNETYPMPAMPEGREDEVRQGAVEGMYRFAEAPEARRKQATILFSGPMWQAAVAARDELAERWDVACDLWSVTSYKRLREDALAAERHNRLHPDGRDARTPLVTVRLADVDGPVVAVSDNMCAVPDQVSRWVGRPYTSLGTDGFGRSDTREALRCVLRGRRTARGDRRARLPVRLGRRGGLGGVRGHRSPRHRRRRRPALDPLTTRSGPPCTPPGRCLAARIVGSAAW